MHPVTVRYDVQRARAAGLSTAWVESPYAVARRTQQRICQETLDFGMPDPVLQEQHGVGRRSLLSPEHRALLLTWTAADPQFPAIEALRRLTSRHQYHGGKTAVYDFLQRHRPPQPPPLPVIRFEGLPGEFGQHDYGEYAGRSGDGTGERFHFYAGRLKYSRVIHVERIAAENTEALIRGREGLAAIAGGLPLQNGVDNTKAAVVRRTRDPHPRAETIGLQTHCASFLRAAGVHADPAAPYSGKQKGSVEHLVGFVKAGFFARREFHSRADLERQLADWEQWVNTERPCDATHEIPIRRLERERERLHPVPGQAAGRGDYGLVYTVVGGREGVVRFQGNRYSIPAAWIGQPVTVHLHRRHVRLVGAAAACEHPRLSGTGQESLLTTHWEARFVKRRGKIRAKREILIPVGGPAVGAFFTELVHRRPESGATRDLPGLWTLFARHGAGAFAAAASTCLEQQTIGAERVEAYLAAAPTTALPAGVIRHRRPGPPAPGAAAGPGGDR